jgi:arylformamidase
MLTQGHHLDLSSVQTTVHIGAHADAPSHYRPDGAPIDARPLDRYYGPCQVVRVDVARGERVLPRHLPGPVTAPRVLFATGTFPDPDAFTTDFAALSPELLDALAAQGVVLVGLDTPSVDPFDSKALESHQALARHDMAVLEGLVLSHVEPGRYTLIALPLRLEGADASPVRAALAPLP